MTTMTSVESSGRSRRSASIAEEEPAEPEDGAEVQNDEEEQLPSQPTDEGDDENMNGTQEPADDDAGENADDGGENMADESQADEEKDDLDAQEKGLDSSQNDEEANDVDTKPTGRETRPTRKTSSQAEPSSEVKTRSARGGKPQAAPTPDSKVPHRMATRRGLVVAPPPPKSSARKHDSGKASQSASAGKKKAAGQQHQTSTSGNKRSAGANDRENGSSNNVTDGGSTQKDGVWDKFPSWAEILQSYFVPAESGDAVPTEAGRIQMKCQLCEFTAALKPADWNVTTRHIKAHHPVLWERLRKYQSKYHESKNQNAALPDLPPISDDRNDGYDEHAEAIYNDGNKSPTPVSTKQQSQQQQSAATATPSLNTRSSERRRTQEQQPQMNSSSSGKKNTRSQAVSGNENEDAEQEEITHSENKNLPKTRSGRLSGNAAAAGATTPSSAGSANKKDAGKTAPGKRATRTQGRAAPVVENEEPDADEEMEEQEEQEEEQPQPQPPQHTTPKTRGASGKKPATSSAEKVTIGGAAAEIGTMEQRKFDAMLAYFDIIAPPIEQLTQMVNANSETRQRCVLRCTICAASMRIVWADSNGMLMHMQNKHTQLLKQIKRLNPELFREPKTPQPQQQQASGQKLGKQQPQSQQALQADNTDEFAPANMGSRSQPVPMATRRSGASQASGGGFGGSAGKYNNKQSPAAAPKNNKAERNTPNNTLSVLQQQQLALQNTNNKVSNQRAKYGIGMNTTMSAATNAKSDDEIRQFINTNASTAETDLKKHLYQSVLFFFTDFRMNREAGSERFTAVDENLTVDRDDLLARSASPVWQVIQTLSAEAPDQETRSVRRKTPMSCACRLCGLAVSIRFSDIAAALDHLKRSHVRLARCLMRMRELYRARPKAAAFVMSAENLFRLLYFSMFGVADDDTINQQLGEAQQHDGDLLGLHLNVRSIEGLDDLLDSLNQEDASPNGRKRSYADVGGGDYGMEDSAAFNGEGGDEFGYAESLNSANDQQQFAEGAEGQQHMMMMNGGQSSSAGGRLKMQAGGKGKAGKKQRSVSPGVEKPRNMRGAGVQLVPHGGKNANSATASQQQQQVFMMEPPVVPGGSASTAVEPAQGGENMKMRKQLIVVYYQFNMQPQLNNNAVAQPTAERTIIMLPNVGPIEDAEQLEQSCLSRVVQLIRILEEEGTSLGEGSARYELPTDGVTVVDRLLMLGFQVEAQSSSNQQIMWTLTTTEREA